MPKFRFLIAASMLMASAPALAAADSYIKFDTVEGEARTIDIQSWSWGATQTSAGSHQGTARGSSAGLTEPVAADGTLTIVSPRDPASGQATGKRSSCPTGKHFPKATLVLKRETYQLSDVTVSSCEAAGIALTYQKIEMESASGKLKATRTRSNIQNN